MLQPCKTWTRRDLPFVSRRKASAAGPCRAEGSFSRALCQQILRDPHHLTTLLTGSGHKPWGYVSEQTVASVEKRALASWRYGPYPIEIENCIWGSRRENPKHESHPFLESHTVSEATRFFCCSLSLVPHGVNVPWIFPVIGSSEISAARSSARFNHQPRGT